MDQSAFCKQHNLPDMKARDDTMAALNTESAVSRGMFRCFFNSKR